MLLIATPPALHASQSAALTPHQVAMKEALHDKAGRPYCLVAPGDTLTSLGVHFHIQPRSLMTWNDLASESINAGARLYLAPGPASRPASAAPMVAAVPAATDPEPVMPAKAARTSPAPQIPPGLAKVAAAAAARPIHEEEGQAFPDPGAQAPARVAAARVINEAEGRPIPGTEAASLSAPAPAATLPAQTPQAPVAAPASQVRFQPRYPISMPPPQPLPPVQAPSQGQDGFIQDANGAVVMGAAVPPPGYLASTIRMRQDVRRRAPKGAPVPKADERSNPLSGIAITTGSPDFRESIPPTLPAVGSMTDLMSGMPIIDEARMRRDWDATQHAIAASWEAKVFHTVGTLKAAVWTSTPEGPCLNLELATSAQLQAVVIVRVPGNYLPPVVDMTLARSWAQQGLTVEVAGNPAYLDGPGAAQAIRDRRLLTPWSLLAQVARVRTVDGTWQAITLPAVSPQLPGAMASAKAEASTGSR